MVRSSYFRYVLIMLLFALPSLGNAESLQEVAKRFFLPLPKSLPASEADSLEKKQLGKALFFETALSINHSQSCNSCHNILSGGAGTDNLITSTGALGEKGSRNSPSIWNTGLHFALFWDGRAKTLEEQAKIPILNPVEMAMPSEALVVERLMEKEYLADFQRAFPQQSSPLTFNNVLEAIAAFERTLISRDRFDRYLIGDESALNSVEKSGLQLFIKHGCNACHTGPLMGGELFMKMGIVHRYPNISDLGRATVTGRASDRFFFKVPSLRNVTETAPYFHDGAAKTIEQAINETAWHQLGLKLDPNEVQDIKAFLGSLRNIKPFE